MILVDTSVWIDHLRKADDLLISLLNSTQVAIHPFIIGELACGNLKNRAELLALLKKKVPAASIRLHGRHQRRRGLRQVVGRTGAERPVTAITVGGFR